MEEDLEESDLSCSICCRLALDALECQQTQCRKLFCGPCCTQILGQNIGVQGSVKCPFCRSEEFKVRESPLREAISNKLIKCRHCLEKWRFGVINQHEAECDQQQLKCQICEESFSRREIVVHIKAIHSQKIDHIILLSQLCRHPVIVPKQVISLANFKEEQKKPAIGTSGKFYCGGDLLPKCQCCNGKCGPSNGQNCCRCMELDMVRRGLPRGYLVQSEGQVCWRDSLQHFHCEVMYSPSFYISNKTCGKEGYYCRPCRNIQETAGRYESLMK